VPHISKLAADSEYLTPRQTGQLTIIHIMTLTFISKEEFRKGYDKMCGKRKNKFKTVQSVMFYRKRENTLVTK
jgi:hypothetical protein